MFKRPPLTRITSWMWSWRTASAERSMDHLRHRISSLMHKWSSSRTHWCRGMRTHARTHGRRHHSLVGQSAGKVLVNVRVHDCSEMEIFAVPQQIDDENLQRNWGISIPFGEFWNIPWTIIIGQRPWIKMTSYASDVHQESAHVKFLVFWVV